MDKEKNKVSMEDVVPLIEECLQSGSSVTFFPKGISMLPMLRQGKDSVTLSPVSGKLKKYDLPLYRRENGKYVLHRVVKVKNDEYIMAGDHQFEYESGISHRQIVAVVTEFQRDGRDHSVNEIGYQLYCRLWHYSRFPRRCLRALKYRVRRLLKKEDKHGKKTN